MNAVLIGLECNGGDDDDVKASDGLLQRTTAGVVRTYVYSQAGCAMSRTERGRAACSDAAGELVKKLLQLTYVAAVVYRRQYGAASSGS